MIERKEYLNTLIDFKDKHIIKVLTGIRRCGKSTLFILFQNYLLNNGVNREQIISINFEDIDYEELLDYKALYKYIKERLIPSKMNYIFLDEIQNVPNYQKAVDSLFIKNNVDLYLTGSNAYLLSGEIATLLSGRYIEIQMLPLSFKEYVSYFNDKTDLSRKYTDYLINSSFPYTLELNGSKKNIREYLGGIYSTVVLKDIIARKNINDVFMLESIIRFMFDNIGNLCSIKKIADTMTSDGRKITSPTVENYLSALVDSYILYKVRRYDIKGKQYLKTGEKYYVVDIGLRYYLLGTKKVDMGHILENIIYLELLRRGYEIYIGKVGSTEVDFIAINDEGIEYYQVALTVHDEKTLERELYPLNSISDHNPKYLLTLDDDPPTSHNGIKQLNAIDWLLK
ncbi:MAG: ATP-binding protein [Clostridium sp.]